MRLFTIYETRLPMSSLKPDSLYFKRIITTVYVKEKFFINYHALIYTERGECHKILGSGTRYEIFDPDLKLEEASAPAGGSSIERFSLVSI